MITSNDTDLHALLLQEPIDSWGPVYRRIKTHPQEAQERYYQNESPLQLALRARERSREYHSSVINDITLDTEHSIFPTKKTHRTNRIQVLEALIKVDPDVIIWRDDEGRTPLHTACSAGRSFEILQWLLEQETTRRILCVGIGSGNSKYFEDPRAMSEINATCRTDYPGGALALHSVAACSVFDDFYFRTHGQLVEDGTYVDDGAYSKFLEQFERCPVPVKLTPNILAAYASTTTIIKANPMAIWERDCEGEIPLHCAASWGNIGSVLALLAGAIDSEEPRDKISISRSAAASAAMTLNDRNKNSLDCACERVVAFSVHSKEASRTESFKLEDCREIPARVSERNSSRASIVRDDPFSGSGIARSLNGVRITKSPANEERGLALRTSVSTGGRHRFPRCGRSVRSSFSSSFVLSGGAFGLDDNPMNGDALRTSFTCRRTPVHPVHGVVLDEDGDEEFAKVELLAWAACECFGYKRGQEASVQSLPITANYVESSYPERSEQYKSDSFHLVHEVIKLRCPPEVVWHAARKYPLEVTNKDALGRVPLSLACERLVKAHTAVNKAMKPKHVNIPSDAAFEDFDVAFVHNELKNSNSQRNFVESFSRGDACYVSDFPVIHDIPSICAARKGEVPPVERSIPMTTSSSVLPPTNEDSNNSASLALIQQHSFAVEIINMLLYSPVFSSKEMASTLNHERRLPLHIIIDAIPWVDVCEKGENNTAYNKTHSSKDRRMEQTKIIESLIDAYPRALESRDGKTGLYPFMLAAAAATNKWSSGDDYDENCLSRVETVYRLLARNPAVISFCLQQDNAGSAID
ncbi:hypothetical protein ACHAW6_008131 [Cyclotella cf. meneghiniana]